MARRGRPRRRQLTIKSEETSIALGILALIGAGLTLLSFFIDAPGFEFIRRYLGLSTGVAFLFFLTTALKMLGINFIFNQRRNILGQLILVFATATLLHLFANPKEALDLANRGELGGVVGYTISSFVSDIFSRAGAFIIVLGVLLVSLPLSFSFSLKNVLEALRKVWEWLNETREKRRKLSRLDEEEDEEDKMLGDFRHEDKSEHEKSEKEEEEEALMQKDEGDRPKPEIKIKDKEEDGVMINEELNYPKWKLPPIDLLNEYEKEGVSQEDIKRNADIIEETLDSFGVRAKVVKVLSGPSVTQYALNIPLGTKVAKISNLKDDLALALAAASSAVRIEAPIPGTSYIGVEIPNKKPETVYMREIMESDEIYDEKLKLGVGVGRNISGKIITTDLQKMPHLLIAGATGSGKSVLTNAFLTAFLMTKTPDELRFIMVDPKQVELSDYNGIPHLLTPVITDMQLVMNSFKWAIAEMERRYTLFRQAKVRNIEGYNKMMGFAALPYIVIVVDEMADLMLTLGLEIETAVVRLAQKARATGLHLILATQRPSVDVLTGLIKANIPGRVGMSVATKIDSRVILDQMGAESLLGKGDMLFKEPDRSKPYRVQGVWAAPEEIQKVVDFIKDQVEEVEYATEVTESQDGDRAGGPGGKGVSGKFSDDELFADAVRVVVQARKASSSLLQRKLKIGYNRAARLLDELQAYNVVSAQDGSKPRKVLISDADTFLKSKERAD